MGKYSDMLLDQQDEDKKKKWSDLLFQEQTPTGAISTITNEPITKWTPDTTKQADWNAIQKSGWVDKPESKIKIFAASRFPDLPKEEREARYRVINNEILFKGDDGKYHREVHTDALSKLRAMSAGAVSESPAMVLGGIGAVGGPLLSGFGAAGGEGIRKAVGNLVFDEEQTTAGNIKDMSFVAGLTVLGERLGKGLSTGHRKTANKIALGKDKGLKYSGIEGVASHNNLLDVTFTPEEHAKAAIIKKLADEHGIELNPGQLYDKQGMLNIWKYLRAHPQTSNAVQAYEKAQQKQIRSAVQRTAGKISPEEDISITGKNLIEEAENIVNASKGTRTKAVKPIYEKSFKDVPDLDISTEDKYSEFMALKDKLNTLQEKAVSGSPAKTALTKIQEMMKDAGTSTEKLDTVKKNIDKMIGSPSYDWDKSIEKDAKVKIVDFSKALNDLLEKNVPEYKKAKKVYELLTPLVDKYEKSAIGRIASIENETQLSAAASYLFGPEITPKLLNEAKNQITLRNEKLWNDVVGAHIRKTYNEIVETESSEVVNVAGKMHKKLFGSENRREQMKAALGKELYEPLEGLMTVFESASKGIGKESMTMPFSAIDQQLGVVEGSKIYRYAMFTKQAVVESVFKKWNDIIVSGRQDELFKALTNKNIIDKISKLKKMSPKTDLFYKEVGILGMYLTRSAIKNDLLEDDQMMQAH